jgi:glutamate-ammonia-ligase adenylyltransferase
VAQAVRGWHHGRIRATRSPRAREALTKLIPALLRALASAVDPNSAFTQFDRMLSRLPAGVQLFSMLLANPHMLRLLANICGAAPRFADRLAHSPNLLDTILDPDFLTNLPQRPALDGFLSVQLEQSASYEGKLDAARRFAGEQTFRVAVRMLEGQASPELAAHGFTDIAEAVISNLLTTVENEFAQSFGKIEDGAFAVIALGRLGGREMTAASDLDLVFVYNAARNVERSDGAKPLPLSTYYTRLAQRLIAALTAHTAEGGLYEVDMRLRPTGNKGPVALSLESFVRYHATEAWTWERMALTRARVLCGPPPLSAQVEQVIRCTLSSPKEVDTLRRDVRQMRQTLAANFTPTSHWDLKFAPGGLVDIEFVAQYLQLREAPTNPVVLDVSTVAALERLRDCGVLHKAVAASLIDAATLQQTLLQFLRIGLEGSFDTAAASPGLKHLLTRAAGEKDFAALDLRLRAVQSAARNVFNRLLAI